jgi:hypothetical protein
MCAIKNMLLPSIIILTTCNIGYASLGGIKGTVKEVKEAADIFVDGTKVVTQMLTDGTTEITKTLIDGTVEITKTLTDGTIEVTKILTDGTKEVTKTLANGIVAASSQVGIESIKRIAEVADAYRPVAWTVVAIVATYEGCNVLGDLKNNVIAAKGYFIPSNKDATEDLQYSEIRKKLEAKKALRESLMKNAKGKRGTSGIPEACEEDARQFAMAGGGDEVERITETFKKYYGESSC